MNNLNILIDTNAHLDNLNSATVFQIAKCVANAMVPQCQFQSQPGAP